MKDCLGNLPADVLELLRLSVKTASLRGMRVYLVGGFVRDLLLGAKNFDTERNRSIDLDIAVEGDGILFAEDLSGRISSRLIRHKRFGTATVIFKHHIKVDIATARKEIYPQPASLPIVEFGRLKDDLKRRDFSVNAMAIDINENYFGSLIDFFKGKQDLCRKQVRILHDLSFIDDPTRILRAIRFEQRLKFKLEPKTLRLLRQAVKKGMLLKVQAQRLRDELILILKEPESLSQIKRLKQLSGFGFINRHLNATKGIFKLLLNSQVEIEWYKRIHHSRRPLDKWLIYFMALIDNLSLKEAQLTCNNFVFRKGDEKRILSFKNIGSKFIQELSRDDIKPSKIFGLLEPLSYEAILLIKAKYRNPNIKKHIEDFLEIYNGMRVFISGHDLHNLGVEPGPSYQKIFTKALEAKLNGLISSQEEELALIKKLIKNI